MTIDDIFGKLAQHMIKGLMIHSQLDDYYAFLGLKGYAKCHEYHYYEESKAYKDMCNYYARHYNKIIQDRRVTTPEIIPENWYGHVSSDVSSETIQASTKKGFQVWIDWEQETKDLYENMYKELMNIGEVGAAAALCDMIKDVSDELAEAKARHLENTMAGYSISAIMGKQDHVYEKCKKKIKEFRLC